MVTRVVLFVSVWASASGLGMPAPLRRALGQPTEVGHLVFVRHGETDWDKSRFVGWADPDLNERGAKQAISVATALKESGYSFDVCYSSVLKRAVHTSWLLLKELNLVHLPIWKTWRLNERSYGALSNRRRGSRTPLYPLEIGGTRAAIRSTPARGSRPEG